MVAIKTQHALGTVLATVDWLVVNFPRAFSQVLPKPLKIGIHHDIVACQRSEKPSRTKIRQALKYYTSSPAYLACQQAGVARVDLQGHETGEVTRAQAQQAVKRLQCLKAAPSTKGAQQPQAAGVGYRRVMR